MKNPCEETYEAIVVGGGPAGLSAALVLGRCLRRTLLIDAGEYRNRSSKALHCFLSRDGIAPSALLEEARAQLQRYPNVTAMAGYVTGARKLPDGGFEISTLTSSVRAKTLLLATGTKDVLPDIPGMAEHYGKSVHVCPYCDGYENREAPVAVLGAGEKAATFAHLIRQWTQDLVLCTSSRGFLSADTRKRLTEQGIALREDPVTALEGEGGKLTALVFENGERLKRTAVFLSSEQRLRNMLVEDLGCEMTEHGVVCDENGHTSVADVFVAGDVSRDVQLAIVAAAEGARAALAINQRLRTL